MLRIVKNEELPAMLEDWHASFEKADEVVAFEKDGDVRALAGLTLGDETSVSLRVAYRDEGDNVDFINASYAALVLLFLIYRFTNILYPFN